MATTKIDINDLNDKQLEIARSILLTPAAETKYHVIRSGRQSGKTFLIERLAIFLLCKQPNVQGLFCSASWTQTTKNFDEILNILHYDPNDSDPDIIKDVNKGEMTITFINGSKLFFRTASNYDSIRGATYDFLIGDEVAHWPKGALDIIEFTLAAKKDAKGILASTPLGKNDFYRKCQQGMGPNKFVQHYMMTFKDNKSYDLREVEEKLKTLPDLVYRQEYLGEFIVGAGSVFGTFAQYQTIHDLIPYDPNDLYYFGIDVGGKDDSTVLSIVNLKGQLCLQYEPDCGADLLQQANQIQPIIERYKASGYIEINGLGRGLYDILANRLGQPIQEWTTSNESKNELVNGFKVELAQGLIDLQDSILNPKLDNEMCMYQVERTSTGNLRYSHPDGLHDDCVDSMLLAFHAKRKLGYTARSAGDLGDTRDIVDQVDPKYKEFIEGKLTYAQFLKTKQHWSSTLY